MKPSEEEIAFLRMAWNQRWTGCRVDKGCRDDEIGQKLAKAGLLQWQEQSCHSFFWITSEGYAAIPEDIRKVEP